MVLPLELLMQDAKGMIDEALMDVIRYMKFLKIAPARIVLETDSLSKWEKKKIYRKPGIYKDQIIMEDGFDAPLEEFEEYM